MNKIIFSILFGVAGLLFCLSAAAADQLTLKFLGTGYPNYASWSSYGRQLASLLVSSDMVIDFSCWSNLSSNRGTCGVARLNQYGVDKNQINYVLITHHHLDHFDPAEIAKLAQSRTSSQKLTVYGGITVTRQMNDYLTANGKQGLVNVVHFESFSPTQIGPYLVTPLPANHDYPVNEPYVYIIKYGGKQFLYGTDSGTIAGDSLSHIYSQKLDLVIRERGLTSGADYSHMDKAKIAAERADWISHGVIAEETTYALTHLAYCAKGVCPIPSGTLDLGDGAVLTLPVCSPKTCSALGYNCGTVGDGCGGTLNCGTCAAGMACKDGACTVPAECLSHAEKRYYENKLYWYKSCGIREERVKMCTPGAINGCAACSADGFDLIDDDSKCPDGKKCFQSGCVASITQGLPLAVVLKSAVNNKYVCAESIGAEPLIANRHWASTWETFDLLPQSDGTVAFRSQANNKYVTAANAGASPLIASRDAISVWEKFAIVSAGSNYVSFKLPANNKYVTAENAGASPLIASRDAISVWEKFAIIPLTTQYCQNQCSSSGDRRCGGDGYQICQDGNGDGCLEWGAAIVCPSGENCINGTCAKSKACIAGAVSGCRVCDNNGLVWVDTDSRCSSGQVCVAGICQSACAPKTCLDLGYDCGTASDGCGGTLNCGACAAGKICENGACIVSEAVPKNQVCTPKEVSGCRICNMAGTDWINDNLKCANGEMCIAGECVSGCTDRIVKKCAGDELYQYNSCNGEEYLAQDCAAEKKICQNGACVSAADGTVEPKNSAPAARAEILQKIAEIKQLLAQLIAQLIAELQRQLAPGY